MFKYPFLDTTSKRWLWALVILFFFSGLGTYGMFVDGLTYATIARNWVEMGFPIDHYMTTPSLHNPFLGHPPVAFWLQGLLFSFGDFFWWDRAYSLLTLVVQLYLLQRMWNSFMGTAAQHHPFPILLFITMPIIHWSYTNNMLENTMGIFTFLAVFASMKGLQGNLKMRYLLLYVASLLGAVLTKGPVGLFPLAAPFLCLFAFGVRQIFMVFLWYFISIVVGSFMVFIFINLLPDTYDFLQYLEEYILHQIIYSLTILEMNDSQTFIIERLISIIAIPIGIMMLIRMWARWKNYPLPVRPHRSLVIFWALVAATASIPIAISPKQAEAYLIPSLPYIALACAACCYDIWIPLKDVFRFIPPFTAKVLSWNALLIAIAVIIFRWGDYNRDETMITTLDEIATITGKHRNIQLAYTLTEEWSLRLYAYRYHHIDLRPTDETFPYYLTKDNYQIPSNCQVIKDINTYNLCQCN